MGEVCWHLCGKAGNLGLAASYKCHTGLCLGSGCFGCWIWWWLRAVTCQSQCLIPWGLPRAIGDGSPLKDCSVLCLVSLVTQGCHRDGLWTTWAELISALPPTPCWVSSALLY